MVRARKGRRVAVTLPLLLLMGVLVAQALGYGIGFFFDPTSGLGEFASPPPAEDSPLTVALIGLVGVGMLAAAAALSLAAILIFRRHPGGLHVAMFIGCVYVLAGVSVLRAGWTGDAGFYLGSGGLLVLLAGATRLIGGSLSADGALKRASAFLGAILVACSPSPAVGSGDGAAAEAFFRGVYECDEAAIRAHGSADVSVSYPLFQEVLAQPAIRGIDEVVAFSARFCTRWLEPRITIHDSVVDSARVVLVWSFEARPGAPPTDSIDPDAPTVSWGGISYFVLNEDGRVAMELGEESTPGPVARMVPR